MIMVIMMMMYTVQHDDGNYDDDNVFWLPFFIIVIKDGREYVPRMGVGMCYGWKGVCATDRSGYVLWMVGSMYHR